MTSGVQMAIGNGLLIATCLLATAYAIVYHFTARWWETEFGRSLMSLKIAIALVTGLAIPRILTGANPAWYGMLRIVVFVAVPLTLAWRLAVLIKIQRQARKEDHR
jgi:hypothetical protein